MPRLRNFSKYHGAGNDFLLFDDFSEDFPLADRRLISELCRRKTGIGADGLILVRPSVKAIVSMVYFNADGSSAPLCGNGLRCLGGYLKECGKLERSGLIETQAGLLTVKCEKEKISTCFPLKRKESLHLGTFIDTGAAHLVVFSSDLEKENVLSKGRRIRFLPDFSPDGVNVTFVQVLGFKEIAVRVYERGVEEETLACGTGAMAGAIAAAGKHGWKGSIGIMTQSQERLEALLDEELWLCGSAVKVFEGAIHFEGIFCKTVD